MEDGSGLTRLIAGLPDQISVLIFSGVAGAFFRAVIAPEKAWARRIVQGVAGALSAVFLGGLLGHILNDLTHAGTYAYLASGFIMGSGGEVAVKQVQDKIFGKE